MGIFFSKKKERRRKGIWMEIIKNRTQFKTKREEFWGNRWFEQRRKNRILVKELRNEIQEKEKCIKEKDNQIQSMKQKFGRLQGIIQSSFVLKMIDENKNDNFLGKISNSNSSKRRLSV